MEIRFRKTLHPHFKQFPFTVIDVGARGGIKKEWEALRPFLKYIAFEPDPEEYKSLTAKPPEDYQAVFYNTALWSSRSDLSLHITSNEGFSSVFAPDPDFLGHFDALNTRGYTVQKKVPMRADCLDNLLNASEKQSIDFIKIDVEGGASEVLKGAERTLADGVIMGLQVESEFNPKYRKQPLFHDVDRILRSHRYELFAVETCCWKRKAGLKTGGTQGQLIHGDSSYFLSPDVFFEKISNFDGEKKISKAVKFIALLCLYGIYDLAFEILADADAKGILPPDLIRVLRFELRKAERWIFRIPKLAGRSVAHRIFYHAFMLLAGIWLERCGYWKTKIRLG